MKLLKFFIAVLLGPAAVALSITTGKIVHALAFNREAYAGGIGWAFWGGYALWLLVFVALPKPMRTYVLGHELTHAVWALVMGARVGGLKVAKTGGQVRTSKTNWAIVLAPYFFPFYAMLFLGAFFIAHAVWGLDRYLWVLFFLVGLGWSFHVTFTLMMLLTTSQPDVRSQGVVFSAVVIYCMNLLTVILTVALLAQSIPVRWLAATLGGDLWQAYAWTLDKLWLLWHRFAS